MIQRYFVDFILIVLYTALLEVIGILTKDNMIMSLLSKILASLIGTLFWSNCKDTIQLFLYRITGASKKAPSVDLVVREFENIIIPAHEKIFASISDVQINNNNHEAFIDLYYFWGRIILFIYNNCINNGYNEKYYKKYIRKVLYNERIEMRYRYIDLEHVRRIMEDVNRFKNRYSKYIEQMDDYKELYSYINIIGQKIE